VGCYRITSWGQSQESGCIGLDEFIQTMNCDGKYNVSEGAKCAKAATVSDIAKEVKHMQI
jgi:hypothetical protein